MAAATDIVKSKYIVDPNNPDCFIRRDGTPDAEKEYWERVNKDRDNVSSVAKMFDASIKSTNESEERRQSLVKVGKIKRDSFLENFNKSEEIYRDQVKTGKINADDFLLKTNRSDDWQKPEIKVGKISKTELFKNEEREEVSLTKPKMQIGKLDPNQIFNSSNNDDKENNMTKTTSPTVGRINTKILFENNNNNNHNEEMSEKHFSQTSNIGRLNIQENLLFERSESPQKSTIKVGKIRADEVFNQSPTDEKPQAKFYKPSVQPKKIKVEGLFKEACEEQQNSSRSEIRVGKINANTFLQNLEENNNKENATQVKVGKLDPNKLFCQEDENDDSRYQTNEETVNIRKININDVFPTEKEEERKKSILNVGKLKQDRLNLQGGDQESEERSKENVQVGRVRNVYAETLQGQEEPSKVILRGGRKVNKGNRISCLIENLHTERKNDSDEEEKDEDDKEVEELKLGRDRMMAIQSMFSGQERRSSTNAYTPSNDQYEQEQDFDCLKDEGLVSSNLQRFEMGATLGHHNVDKSLKAETNYIDKRHIESVSAMFEGGANNKENDKLKPLPRKLKNVDEVFHHGKEQYTDCDRIEVKVGKLDSQIFKPISEESESGLKVNQSPTRVGKLSAENIFSQKAADDAPSSQKEVKVGKLNKGVYNPNTENETQTNKFEVGKISTKDLFKNAEDSRSDSPRQTLTVGKLSEDKFMVGSQNEETSRSDSRTADPDLLSLTGKVSEKTNDFLNNASTDKPSSPITKAPVIKRSESSAAADLQKKYQEQMASKGLKRNKTEKHMEKLPSLVVRKDNLVEQKVKEQEAFKSASQLVRKENKVEKKLIASRDWIKPEDDEEKVEHKAENAAMLAEATVQSGKIKDARSSFFQSMMTNTNQNSSVQRLGTAVMPTGVIDECRQQDARQQLVGSSSSSRGQALFKRQADKVDELESEQDIHRELLPGVDLEEIEDEFERLHREMMREGAS